MIVINKNTEPDSWKAYRETPGTAYSPSTDLRQALLTEQFHICAFCMRRIPAQDSSVKETSKIAHLLSRANHPKFQKDYTNMVLSCPGNMDGNAHCDNAQRSADITLPVFSPRLTDIVSYETKNGRIKSSHTEYHTQINTVLRLNNERLMSNRLNTLDGIIAILDRRKWTRASLEQKLEEWTNPKSGKLTPYCGIVIWYLNKKLSQKK